MPSRSEINEPSGNIFIFYKSNPTPQQHIPTLNIYSCYIYVFQPTETVRQQSVAGKICGKGEVQVARSNGW